MPGDAFGGMDLMRTSENEKGTCINCGKCSGEMTIFAGVPEEKRKLVTDQGRHLHKRKGSYLFRAGEPVGDIWILRSGKVKLCVGSPDGREMIIGIFAGGEAIWEGLFLNGSLYPYSAVCLTTVDVCAIPVHDFQTMLQDTSVAWSIITVLSRKLHDANERNMILSAKEPEVRVAKLLLYEVEHVSSPEIDLRLEDIAASLNLRPETVSRKLREMEKAGILKRTGKGKLHILDQEAIRQLAG